MQTCSMVVILFCNKFIVSKLICVNDRPKEVTLLNDLFFFNRKLLILTRIKKMNRKMKEMKEMKKKGKRGKMKFICLSTLLINKKMNFVCA